MTAPGELRHRLVLEAPVETPDGAGGVTRSHVALATIWAKVTPVSARDQVVASSAGATITHRVVIRRRTDVTTRHRFRDGARIFRILAQREADGSGRFTEISVEERVA